MLTKLLMPKLVMRATAVLLVLSLALGVSSVNAAGDRTPPTKPSNLRVTAVSAYSVSLAWNPSSDNSGVFSYKIHVSYGQTWTVSQTQTSFNWNFGLVPANSYSFYVYAVDGSGNQSSKSNTASPTLLADTTPPTAPVLTLVDVNPTEVSLTWTASTDDGPYLFYQVFVNGSPNIDAGTKRSAVVHGLAPDTNYVITVRARDLYGAPNWSAPSNAVSVTTDRISAVDTEAPPPPADLAGVDRGCAEVELSWTQSFDNQTAQSAIRYDVYVNGTLDHSIIGADHTVLYGNRNGDNTFTVIAIDGAGNLSTPATTTLLLSLCGGTSN